MRCAVHERSTILRASGGAGLMERMELYQVRYIRLLYTERPILTVRVCCVCVCMWSILIN